MRSTREQFDANRQKILASAVQLFSERGLESVALVDVMRGAGLTHGGFYRHFRSKDDLVAQACAFAVKLNVESESRSLVEFCTSYLTEKHRDNRSEGCPFIALGNEAPRLPAEARTCLSQGLRRVIDRLSATAPGATASERRVAAIASFSAMMGGVTLARLTDDSALSKEILVANRKTLKKLCST